MPNLRQRPQATLRMHPLPQREATFSTVHGLRVLVLKGFVVLSKGGLELLLDLQLLPSIADSC